MYSSSCEENMTPPSYYTDIATQPNNCLAKLPNCPQNQLVSGFVPICDHMTELISHLNMI